MASLTDGVPTKPLSVEVPGAPDISGEGKPRRNVLSPDKLISFPICTTTLYENFLHGVKESGGGNFLGHRQIVKGVAGPYVWETYPEVQQRVENFGSGLRNLGLKVEGILGFFSTNNPQCVIGELACYQYNFISVPIFDTSGTETVEHIINQTEMEYCLTTPSNARVLLNLKKALPTLKTIVVLNVDEKAEQELIEHAAKFEVRIVNFVAVEEDGAADPIRAINPSSLDIATICYTSGTTGTPKGAVLTHKNFMSIVGSMQFLAEKGKIVGLTNDDIHISYLSSAHVFERTNEAVIIYKGGAIGFYQGDTLKLLDDIAELRPTIFVSVPRLLNRVYDIITASVKMKGGITLLIFNIAFNIKKNGLAKGNVNHWVDRFLYGRIRAKLGGRIKAIFSGSAPISSDIMDFLRICFSVDVYEGYGQTESAGGLTVSLRGDTSSGHVGPPHVCTEIKLVDVPEMNYTSRDKPYPRGEICVRGPAIFKGYYKDPGRTAETIDENRWCHTGDVGMWDEMGRLVIIDRTTNFFKLAHGGDYISPEKIEKIYEKHELVAQAFVHGDSLQTSPVSVIVPDRDALLQWARDNDLCDHNYKSLCALSRVKKNFLITLTQYGKENNLRGFENAKNVYLSSERFTLQNGLLTPTLKLRRHQARIKYQKEIEAMYAEI